MSNDLLLARAVSLTSHPDSGDCIIYVMSRDQRVKDNHALLLAQQKALNLKLPLVVAFNLLSSTGVRAREHYEFMLAGLCEVADGLEKLSINFVMTTGEARDSLPALFAILKPAHVYFDFNPMPGVRGMQEDIANSIDISCTVVDTHNIIPAHVLSDKQEFAAHTIRRKVHKRLAKFLVEPDELIKHPYSLKTTPRSFSFDEANEIIASISPCGITMDYISGEKAARKHLEKFMKDSLDDYAADRNNIAVDGQSGISPYLHFGQISSLRVALEVMYTTNEVPLLFRESRMASAGDIPTKADGMNALLEEMIVRKELSDNYCLYSSAPTKLSSIPEWAQKTLALHADDPREHIYTREQLEQAKTHDNAWNAAQLQMTRTGKMHGYMRMYWAKKLLEWSNSPQEAIDTAVYLNDHYSLDGGDPNGYAGIMWSIAGLHDRPWTERPIFGQIRYMNYEGLKRKFDIDIYIQKWHK